MHALTRPLIRVAALFTLTACGAAPPAGAPSPAPAAPSAPAPPDLPAADTAALQSAGIPRERITCRARNRWSSTLRGEAKATAAQILDGLAGLGAAVPEDKRDAAKGLVVDAVFWRMVLTQLVDGEMHNLGVVPVRGHRTADGAPLLVFRTAFTAEPERDGSCVDSLVDAGVRHTVNLYAGPMPTQDLEAAEEKRLTDAGGSYFSARKNPELSNFRETLRDEAGPDAAQAAMRAVARLVNEQILRPGGAPPRGHVQVHCGGGMHRTGMVVGVIERCVNGAAMPEVAERFKRHVGWRSDAEPGGYEPENLEFIEHFDCGLIATPR
jgi:hypothetical protein